MSTFTEIYLLLKTYGDKLGPALVIIQLMVDAWIKGARELADLFGGGVSAVAAHVATAEEAALEAELLTMLAGEGRAGFFQNFFTFLRENPWIAQLLLSFLKQQQFAAKT